MDTRELVLELKSAACRCGRLKAEGKTLCTTCWRRLPADVQHRLYRLIGSGYAEARQAAVEFLDKTVRA